MDILGMGLSVLGICLTVWSVWYARQQSKLISSIQRNEMISLWAFLDRIRTMLLQMENNGLKDGQIEEEKIEIIKSKVLPQLFKGLCDQYVMIAELIVQKTPGISLEDVERWVELNRLKTKWQKNQFVNLVEAANATLRKKDIKG